MMLPLHLVRLIELVGYKVGYNSFSMFIKVTNLEFGRGVNSKKILEHFLEADKD